MKLIKIASGVSASAALLGMGGFAASAPQAQVQAAVKYQIRVSKKAYVYTSKGKKTKKSYKKNAKVTVYGIKWIKGKKYYNLGRGRYIRTSNARKVVPRYRYSTQTKKITRTIKMYQPKGVKKVIQNAYIKRTVKTDNKTKKKTYGAWSTSSWKKYKVAKVSGYTASRSSVGAAKVTYKRKNQMIKITYKVIKKTNKKKKTSKKTDTKHATKPSTTPAKPANSGSSGSNGNSGSSSSSSSSSSSTSKPSTVNYSSSTKKTFTVKANNEVTTSRGKEYKYTMYSKSGSTFTSKGDTTALDGEQAFTVSDQATDSNGNTYYYVTDTDGNEYWVLSTDTDKPDNSHKAKNTLSITSANFNVERNISSADGSKNIDMYTLNSDNTLKKYMNAATTEWFEGKYYPVVFHVTATATDNNGTKWYNITNSLDNNKSIWVKTDGFTVTTKAAGSTHPTLVWDEYWQKKLQSDLLTMCNELRAQAGNGAQPLTLATDKQEDVKELAEKYALKTLKGELYGQAGAHTPPEARNAIGSATECAMEQSALGDRNSVSSSWMEDLVFNSYKNYITVVEKKYYDEGGHSFWDYGHYYNSINPEYSKTAVGSTVVDYQGKAYVVAYQEFWK